VVAVRVGGPPLHDTLGSVMGMLVTVHAPFGQVT
jgi:hypothetical protein